MFSVIAFIFLWSQILCLPSINGKTKEGFCPKPGVSLNATTPCVDNCSEDSDCAEDMKCCNTSCGLSCVYSERPGFCPFNDLPITGEVQEPKCKSDFDCEKNTKCCARGSSHDCLPASREKPGKCPTVCKLAISGPRCYSDHDCPDNLKCCNDCGQRCIKPGKGLYVFPLD
ncbi:perlwapin-like [Spea bombifrons]|uniref:perlwapin-like n=1 Tax=Spea bombifrons TaxID=233779 RepID=UPI002348EF99|nr:perlwapin-like [Spea bombifrons]